MDALRERRELWSKLKVVQARKALQGEIQACHTPQHYKTVARAEAEGIGYLDGDTAISIGSMDAALYGAGAACQAVDLIMSGEINNAFIPARPPGHHATSERAMGFCLFNSVAVAARYGQGRYQEIERVAILDWDVHHGNGTQGIFYDDPSVFFLSTHQYPWYPGTGARSENGIGRGRHYTLNVPLRAFTPAKDQIRIWEAALDEISSNFKPDLIFISAGFDSHEGDPLGQLLLQDEDFVLLTRAVKEWAESACNGRIVSCLEGGYNLSTLGATVAAHVAALQQ